MIIKPHAQRGWKPRHWAFAPTSATALGKAQLSFVPMSITSTALHGPGSRRLPWQYKLSHPQGDPGGDASRNRKPRTSQESFLRQARRGAEQDEGLGLGQPMQEPQDFQQSRSPTPGTPTFQQRHRNPPSQGMPVDTAGKGHTPGHSPRTLQPSTSEPVAGSGVGKKYFFKNYFL